MNDNIKPQPGKKRCSFSCAVIILFFLAVTSFTAYKVLQIYKMVSGLRISDSKMEYVYQKVNDLVNVLNTKDTSITYNPTEKYDFKPASPDELVSDKAAAAPKSNEALKQELSQMNDGDKLKLLRDKLVDIYKKSQQKDEDLTDLKRSFSDTKSAIETWYNDKKNITAKPVKEDEADQTIVGKLKKNLSNYIQISKIQENIDGDKKILDIEKIPEMLSYAEILMEAGSFTQASWILEDIASVTKQPEITTFNAEVQTYINKYPNPDMETQQIKELLDLIENKG